MPDFMRNISLLVDVPFFFFLTGCVIYKCGISSQFVLKQTLKISFSFTVLLILLELFFLDFNIERILKSVFFDEYVVPQCPVLPGSYWFVPVYIKSLFLCSILLIFLPKYYLIYSGLLLLIIIYPDITSQKLNIYFLGTEISYIAFYSLFIIFGYKMYPLKNKFLFVLLFLISLIFFVYNMVFTLNFSLQNNKFPPTIIYFITQFISISLFMIYKRNDIYFKFTNYFGKNALFLYMSQGISSSIIYNIVPYIKIFWFYKLIIVFFINIILSIIICYSYVKIYSYVNNIIKKFGAVLTKGK